MVLHESHHRPRAGTWELNDLYAVIFAVPSIALLYGGVQLGWWPGFVWIGAGIAAYGAIYFGFTMWSSTGDWQCAICPSHRT
jgi:beta-carotene 3-hydroxylase